MTAGPKRPRYRVRIEIPRISGTRGWSAAATAFEQGLAAQPSLLVTERQIQLVTRQRRDYVRVSVMVEAAHIAEAAVVAWSVLQQAAGEDTEGWDLAGASAEIQPVKDARLSCSRCRYPAAQYAQRCLEAKSVSTRGRLRGGI